MQAIGCVPVKPLASNRTMPHQAFTRGVGRFGVHGVPLAHGGKEGQEVLCVGAAPFLKHHLGDAVIHRKGRVGFGALQLPGNHLDLRNYVERMPLVPP